MVSDGLVLAKERECLPTATAWSGGVRDESGRSVQADDRLRLAWVDS
jgi:hypothetical protein